jgi:MoaA/NifB/PqqE/SkfB family radical SAM enzyme
MEALLKRNGALAMPPEERRRYDFYLSLKLHQLNLAAVGIETLQMNITRLCNQACLHCHVDASPKRTEMMARRTLEKCLEILAEHDEIKNLDITGGAPELHPDFDELAIRARKLHKHVMVRHNLTVTCDGNPQTGERKTYLPQFFAGQQVEVISSLPYYQEFFTDKQRGRGVFQEQLQRLGSYEAYMTKLLEAFNPEAARGVMCQSLLSVGYDGKIYDCDFNQMLDMPICNGTPMTVFDFDWADLQRRAIRFDSHCYGCTAGAGSSCGGATT